MLTLFDKPWSASIDDVNLRKEVMNECNHWSCEEGKDGFFLFQLEEGCGHGAINAQQGANLCKNQTLFIVSLFTTGHL